MNYQTGKFNKRNLLRLFGVMLISVCSTFAAGCKAASEVTSPSTESNATVKFWLTDPKQNVLFTEQQNITPAGSSSGLDTITVNSEKTYQSMDGFGFALTGGSAYHIYNMSAAGRKQLLTELFDASGKNIGISYLRISIGASDLDAKVFSYDDLSSGENDFDLQKFSLSEDKKWLIPVLKEILAINPNIKLLGSPWSAPLWMKTNRSSVGGSLRPECFDVYAKYLVKYVQEMKDEGITIDAITVQNEPLNPGNEPSMYMSANDQATFIKTNLGPAFKNAGLQTKIIIYDHNADRTDYPLAILNDAAARQYVDGSAFHLYGGDISALSQVHNYNPDKNLYFTEQWIGAGSNLADNLKWHTRELIIGASRNWCKNVLEWNLAADQNYEPHTPGGCNQCMGAVTIQGDQVTRNSGYYIIAHASKFVRPGSKRIDSNSPADLPNVAFLAPDGSKILIVLNNGNSKRYFNIRVGDKTVVASLLAGAVGTYIW